MTWLAEVLVANAGWLVAGSSLLLCAGSIGVVLTRSPHYRQRIAELTMAAMMAWFVLAWVPVARPNLSRGDAPIEGNANVTLPPSQIHEVPRVSVQINGEPESPLAQPSETTVSLPTGPRVTPPSISRSASNLRPFAERKATITERKAANRDLNWPLLIAYAFLAGAMACAAWVVAGWIALRRLLARARRPEAWLQSLLEECQVEPCSRVRLLVSDRASRPLTCGWPRPTIVLPGFLGWEWSAALACVLRHELVHARRGDPLGQLLFCGALPLVYWHPLYWFLRRSVARSRELVADDEASAPIGRRHYARHMVCLARRCRSGGWSLGTVGMFRSTTQFFWRMNMLLHRSHSLASRSTRTWRWLSTATCVLVVAAAATLWGVRTGQAQPAPEDPPTGGPAQPSPTTPAPGEALPPPTTTSAPPTPVSPEAAPSVGAALDPTDDPSTDPVPPKASNQVAGDPDQPPRNRKELRRDILKRVEQLLNELEEPGDTASPELHRFDKMLRELVDQNRKRRAGGPVTVPGPGAGLPSAEPSRTPALPGGPPAVVEPNYRRGARATAALGTVSRAPYAHQVGGADVGASDVLAFAANFATAQAEHTVAEAEVRAVEQSLRDDPDKNLSRELSFKRAALKAAREKSRLFVRVADIARESAKAELQSAQEELDQLRQLHKQGVIPHTQVTRAQRTQAQAESRLKILASLVEDTPAKAEEPSIRSR